jgi:cytochrome d ubiquinol oxidase subunit I
VYDVMTVNQSVTGASDIPVGYGALSAVYLVLAVIVYLILRHVARIPLPADPGEPPGPLLASPSPSPEPETSGS